MSQSTSNSANVNIRLITRANFWQLVAQLIFRPFEKDRKVPSVIDDYE